MAVLAPGDGAYDFWVKHFGGTRVPVENSTPSTIHYDEGGREDTVSYLIDFETAGAEFKEALKIAAAESGNEDITAWLARGILPLKSDGLTIIQGPARLWMEKL